MTVATAEQPARQKMVKSASAFRTISEVSDALTLPQHVLRFWESKFPQLRPLKRGGGRRYYRPEDVELVRRIRGLLREDGYTIKGVQKILRDEQGKPAQESEPTPQPEERQASGPGGGNQVELRAILAELEKIRDIL